MFEKYTENDYLNSIVNIQEIQELNNQVKINLSELLFFCVGKTKPFVVSILSLELSKYYKSQILRNAIVEKVL